MFVSMSIQKLVRKWILRVSYEYDDMRTVKKMKEIVPEFLSINSPFEAVDRLLEKISKETTVSKD